MSLKYPDKKCFGTYLTSIMAMRRYEINCKNSRLREKYSIQPSDFAADF